MVFAIIGAAGKVGYATSVALRKAGMPVRAILRDPTKAVELKDIGCEIAVADLHDSAALAKVIGNADAVQVIIPPTPRAEDPAEDMRRAIESVIAALEEVRPKRVLVISDYGAHVDHDIGMPTIFHAFEERLRQLDGHKLFLRSAEHMQNWGRVVPIAMASGSLPTFHDPADILLPTISAPDVGLIAADLLLRPVGDKEVEIVHAEGPRRYSAEDVATALSELLGRTINVGIIPRSRWKETFEMGMNASLAELLIKANDAQNKGGLVDVEPKADKVKYGRTELIDAMRPLIPPLKSKT